MNNWKKSSLIYIIIVLIISASFVIYNAGLRKELSLAVYNNLYQVMLQEKQTFVSKIQDSSDSLKVIAELLPIVNFDAIENNKISTILQNATKNSVFDYMLIVNTKGIGINQNGEKIDISNNEFFQKSLNIDPYISEPFLSTYSTNKVIAITTSIKDLNDNTLGSLIGLLDVNTLGKLFFPFLDSYGYAYICKGNGEVITKTDSPQSLPVENIFDVFKLAKITQFDNYKTAIKKIEKNIGGRSTYVVAGQTRLAVYEPLGINNWYIVSMALEEAIAKEYNLVMSLTIILSIAIILAFAILIAYLLSNKNKYAKKLFKAAYYDELTGLRNLTKFKLDAERILLDNREASFAIIKFDVYRFKMFNEILGYEQSNEIIKGIARALLKIEAENTITARINADEFMIFGPTNIIMSIDPSIIKHDHVFDSESGLLGNYKLESRFGRYLIAQNEINISEIIEKVNLAHRAAKQGKSIEVFDYNEELKKQSRLELEVENNMEEALENREFAMFLQPKYQLSDESLAGAEALARWWVDGRFIMHPTDFIPVFEKNGFVKRLDMYMFEEACKFIKSLIDNKQKIITISVNFSRLHLLNNNFVQDLCAIADKYQVPHHYLEIELTESIIIDNEDLLFSVLENLHKANFTLSMDDFGSGYSSLGLLKNMPIDVLKIDYRFFDKVEDNLRANIVIASVISLAKNLNMKTVAEGVETKDNIDFLKSIDCDMVQGFYYSKPMPFEEFKKKL